MKKLLLFLILNSSFLIVNCYSQQYGWVALPWINNSDVIKRIYLSGNEAWLLTNDKLYYSANYPSVQFSQLFYNSIFKLNDMTFVNNGLAKYGWLVGSDAMGARTIDTSALVWTEMYLSGDQTYSCISFPNVQVGYGCGTDKRLHKTTSGGIDWFDTGVQLGVSSVDALFFLDTLIGYSGGASPSFKKTTDGGMTWMNAGNITGSIIDIYFYDNSNGCVVGVSDILYFHGSSWVRIANPSGSTLYSVFLVSPLEGWTVGLNGTITHTIDGGATWTNQASGTNVTLRDVFFTSPTNGYAVGNSGTILHYTLLTDVEELPTQPTEFKLEQNYPNPFNPTTTISWQLPVSSWQTLKVYDVLGNEVVTLVDEYRDVGSYEVEFQSAISNMQLASGVYYYQLRAGDYLETKKMILLR